MALRAALQELTHKYIKAVQNLDLDGQIAPRLPDCIQQFSPKSLGLAKPLNSEEFRHAAAGWFPEFKNFKFDVHNIITDTESQKVVLQANGSADTIVGPYINEYVFILHATEDGTKLKLVEEFFDSLKSVEWLEKLKAAREAKENTA
ncbi:hypothetical protein MMC22_003542 [Lobaria immixta]|nr:hypothetical protein [Lobaria immixta]